MLYSTIVTDLEMNEGTPERPYFMSQDLLELLGKKNIRSPESAHSKELELEETQGKLYVQATYRK